MSARARARLSAVYTSSRVTTGETVVGIKLGLTSRAKQERMGISSPLTAVLTDAYILPADVPVPLGRLIQPRAEPELVFVMGRPLRGPGVTAATALAAVDRVYGGFEIIDSRYVDYDFALPDVVADNASSAFFVVGGVGQEPIQGILQAPLRSTDLRALPENLRRSVQFPSLEPEEPQEEQHHATEGGRLHTTEALIDGTRSLRLCTCCAYVPTHTIQAGRRK